MFNAKRPSGIPPSFEADDIVHLTFPVRFERPAAQPPLHGINIPVGEDHAPALSLTAAAAEMHRNHALDSAEAWQIQVDMTLAEAEDLVEGLRSLIAAAKESLPEPHAAQPTALALAGLKVGAVPPGTPARISNAQREALSRMKLPRGVELGPDGLLLHALAVPAKLHHKPARLTR